MEGELPIEVMDCVMGYLDVENAVTIGRVSKTYREYLIHRSQFWEVVDFTNVKSLQALNEWCRTYSARTKQITCHQRGGEKLPLSLWLDISATCEHLESISVTRNKEITDMVVVSFWQHNPSLSKLTFSHCPWLSDSCFRTMTHVCGGVRAQQLEVLDFSHCRLISADGIVPLLRKTSQLQYLNVKGCPKINSHVLETALLHCMRLKYISVGGCGKLTNDVFTKVVKKYVSENEQNSLEYLNISCSNPFGARSELLDFALVPFLKRCGQLKSLYLKGHSLLTHQVALALNPQVRTLDLTGCTRLTTSITTLSFLHQLEELILYSCKNVTDDFVHSLKEQNTMLKKIDLEGCSQLSPQALALFTI